MQHMEAFSSQENDVQWHIQSQYAKEMNVKSEVVSLISNFTVRLVILPPIGSTWSALAQRKQTR